MLYVNQLEYPHIKYYHNAANGGPEEGRDNVETSGCGLCCACMMVEHLTTGNLALEECVKLSEENGALILTRTSAALAGDNYMDGYNFYINEDKSANKNYFT
ncbi:MAG: hypothetical protein IJM94_04570, partial [Clostridia bacterium]|nr:hypothetical protein [Clostridia bacterium]